MASGEISSNWRVDAQRDIFAVTVSFGGEIGFGSDKVHSLRFHLDIFRILEGQERHEVGVVHDESLGGSLNQIALRGVGGDDVTNRVGHTAFESEGDAGEGMAQSLAAFALAALAVGTDFVLQQLAHVGQNCARDHSVHVDRQGASHEIVHGLGAVASNVYHAAFVLHKGDGAVRNQQGERDLVQVSGFEGTALQRFDPSLGNLFA